MFYDETCTVSSSSVTTTDGEQRETFVTVEASVPCAFYGPGNAFDHGDFAQRQGTEGYTLVLPGAKSSLAVKGRRVTVGGLNFLIDSVQVHKIPSGVPDNAECRLTQLPNA
jgi:hypothetical protein